MKQSHTFLVPDYFPQFACKMGECRSACCVGWPVTISRDDYFHLLGVECSTDLRGRLNCAMYLVDYPTPEEYARFKHRYDGECAARLPDGRCAIQAELGEDYLADVCRLYPRGVRVEEGDCYECSCTCSCEAVIEAFLDHPAPLAFIAHPMTLSMPRVPARDARPETFGRAQEMRLFFLRVMQNRSLPLSERLMHLGAVLRAVEAALQDRDEAALNMILAGSVAPPDLPTNGQDERRIRSGLAFAAEMIGLLDTRSDSIRERGEAAQAYFGRDDGALARYLAARDEFAARFPHWQIWFEHMLVNHMFFVRFPFGDASERLEDAFTALCAAYALLRYLELGTRPADEMALVDTAAAYYRLIAHTDFTRMAVRLCKQVGCVTDEQLLDLVRL